MIFWISGVKSQNVKSGNRFIGKSDIFFVGERENSNNGGSFHQACDQDLAKDVQAAARTSTNWCRCSIVGTTARHQFVRAAPRTHLVGKSVLRRPCLFLHHHHHHHQQQQQQLQQLQQQQQQQRRADDCRCYCNFLLDTPQRAYCSHSYQTT